MVFWRRHLARVAAGWLVWQVAMLTAAVPVDCCAGHRAHGAHSAGNMTAVQCPMRGADGQPCPMHRAAPAAHAGHDEHAGHHAQQSPADDCVMKGFCRGPMAGFLALLSNVAILPASANLAMSSDTGDLLSLDEQAIRRLDPPDSPPPRS